jgi:hypothetical protein
MTPETYDAEILRLVNAANDPSERATLLVLYKIHQSQAAMATTLAAITQQLTSHEDQIDDHTSMIDKSKGGWRVLTGLGILLWGLFGWVGVGYVAKLEKAQADIVELKIQMAGRP